MRKITNKILNYFRQFKEYLIDLKKKIFILRSQVGTQMALLKFFPSIKINYTGKLPRFEIKKGDQNKISHMYNCYKDQDIIIIANGPSLKKANFNKINNKVILCCNGAYKLLNEKGIIPDHYFIEDRVQAEVRRNELKNIKAKNKFTSIYNYDLIKNKKEWLFFYSPLNAYSNSEHIEYYYNDLFPQFSKDVASVVHLGATIVYNMLQFAYFFGSKKVYLLGLDFTYSNLHEEIFRITGKKRGWITITEENIEVVKRCHYDPNYYKLGDRFALPNYDRQEIGFKKALDTFNNNGREIINLNINSGTNIFPKKCMDVYNNETKNNK